jgi:hypothetical protein
MENKSQVPVLRRLDWPQTRDGSYGKKKIFLLLPKTDSPTVQGA